MHTRVTASVKAQSKSECVSGTHADGTLEAWMLKIDNRSRKIRLLFESGSLGNMYSSARLYWVTKLYGDSSVSCRIYTRSVAEAIWRFIGQIG